VTHRALHAHLAREKSHRTEIQRRECDRTAFVAEHWELCHDYSEFGGRPRPTFEVTNPGKFLPNHQIVSDATLDRFRTLLSLLLSFT
jgi:hypothetical protein